MSVEVTVETLEYMVVLGHSSGGSRVKDAAEQEDQREIQTNA